ncbi:hypothetical protein PR003_g14923 [Phytophthora rubi]|uniref:Uncharacterized protein n=1 Tax=Phytophthora rubi TaxID=129364 RepID=A0A6A4F2T4_9STRA|nr:hypothetical protein PR003_g14923 [Phytophthora rubi]
MSVTDIIDLDPEQKPAISDGVDHGQGKRGEVEATQVEQGIAFVVELEQLGLETEKLKAQQMEFQSLMQRHTSVLNMTIEEHQLDMSAFELKIEKHGLDKDDVEMKNAQHQQDTAALKMKIEGHHQDLCVLKMQLEQQSRYITSLDNVPSGIGPYRSARVNYRPHSGSPGEQLFEAEPRMGRRGVGPDF